MNYKVTGGKKLSGSVTTNISKNATVALLAASLLNRGTTTIKRVPKIEEANRIIEVLKSIGAEVWWSNGDVIIHPSKILTPEKMDRVAAGKTRSTVLFTAPLAHLFETFELPLPGGCNLGGRTMMPHIQALGALGIQIQKGSDGMYKVYSKEKTSGEIAMYESSDTGTESVLMAAAKIPGKTIIKYASANYMVQDLCTFLEVCGVKVEGIGTSTLTVYGVDEIDRDVVIYPSEDPIESMFFISLAATTGSELTIKRCPMDFLELELVTLGQMSQKYKYGAKYLADNGRTVLADVTMFPSKLTAPPEKIAPRPYPGINIDNLPFFVPVATQAEGRTLIHDWVYENRAIYYMEMKKLGANMLLADPHRVFIDGPTPLHAADIEAPPALRPATIILIGMLAAEGESILRNVYPINRGYERLHERLQELGASVEAVE
ncbi:MAG: UDP-N-acetylglucosamine 1-carboxyvinyltransferase [Patescibacteria group bacterium]